MSVGEHLQQFLKVMDDMEHFVESSRLRFLGKVLVDEEVFFTLCNKLRMALPRELKEMEGMTKEAQRIKESAESEAKKIVENAREYAQSLVEQHEIKQRAEKRAEEIQAQAEQQAEAIRKEAKEYAKRVFEKFLESLEQLEGVARQAVQNLP